MSDEVGSAGAPSTRAKAVAGSPRAPGGLRHDVGDPGRGRLHPGRRRGPGPGPRPRPPGRVPVHPGRPGDHVPLPVLDHAPVRGVRDRRRDQRALPLPPRPGPDRPVGRLRPADPDGLRQRRPGGGGGGRPGRGPDLLAGRHGGPVRGHPAGRGQHLDDDQRHGADPARPVRGGGRAAGRRSRRDLGHDPERHPQGVHRPGDLDLPAPGVDAAGDRRVRVRRPRAPQVEHDQHLGLPHAGGRGHGGAGARVHARRRHRLRRGGRRPRPRGRRLRPAAVVLLRRLVGAVRGGRQVPGRPPDVGPDHA